MADVDELFTVRPHEFVARRDELVRELRGEGRREEASEVKGLRRPPVAVWAANQVARRRPDEVRGLVEAAAALPAAQEALLAGDRGRFREAVDRHRSAVSRLAAAGAAIVEEEQVASGDHRRQVADVLEAASTIDAAARQLLVGRLEDRPRALGDAPTGLDLADPSEAPRPAAGRGADTDAGAAEAARAEARRRREERIRVAEGRAADARRALEAAEASSAAATEEVAERERALAEARRRRDEADEALGERRGELEEALAELDAAVSDDGGG